MMTTNLFVIVNVK